MEIYWFVGINLVATEKNTESINEMAKAFKELGHPTRLMVFKAVVKAGFQGVAVGKIQEQLAIPGSTLSHHVSCLASAG